MRLVCAWIAVAVAATMVSACSHPSAGAPKSATTRPPPVSAVSSASAARPATSELSSSAPASTASPAVAAYAAFSSANFAAYRDPSNVSFRVRLSQLTFDPARGQQLGYLVSLVQQGVAWRGRPPTPRVSVLAESLAGKPYPTVTLADCPTPAPHWAEFVVKTGTKVATVPGAAAPPFTITVVVIYDQGHWGVQSATPDTRKTCTA